MIAKIAVILLLDMQQVKHFDRQFRPGAVFPAVLSALRFVQVESKQDRQTENSIRPERKANQHTQHDPTAPPVHNRLAAAGKQRVMVHAAAEHFPSAFASQRVVQPQEDRTLQVGLDQVEQGQSDNVPRTICPGTTFDSPLRSRLWGSIMLVEVKCV